MLPFILHQTQIHMYHPNHIIITTTHYINTLSTTRLHRSQTAVEMVSSRPSNRWGETEGVGRGRGRSKWERDKEEEDWERGEEEWRGRGEGGAERQRGEEFGSILRRARRMESWESLKVVCDLSYQCTFVSDATSSFRQGFGLGTSTAREELLLPLTFPVLRVTHSCP